MTALADGYHDVPHGKLATVVTYLERSQPPAEAAALPEGVRIAPVAAPELGWYRALFRRIGDDWLWFERLQLSDAELAATLADPHYRTFVMTRDGEDVGLIELDFHEPGAVEIVYFGLAPEATGSGLGRTLMAAALAEAFAPGVARVWLHTCDLDDPRALTFYQRMGFVPYARKVEVMDDPRLSGVLPPDVASRVPRL